MGRAHRLSLLVLLLATPMRAAHIERVAGGGERDAEGVPALEARLNEPFATAFDSAGNLYIAEMVGGRILRIDARGMISRLAGRELQGDAGDGGEPRQDKGE